MASFCFEFICCKYLCVRHGWVPPRSVVNFKPRCSSESCRVRTTSALVHRIYRNSRKSHESDTQQNATRLGMWKSYRKFSWPPHPEEVLLKTSCMRHATDDFGSGRDKKSIWEERVRKEECLISQEGPVQTH